MAPAPQTVEGRRNLGFRSRQGCLVREVSVGTAGCTEGQKPGRPPHPQLSLQMSSPTDPNGAFQRSHPSEGMQALEKERKLPLTGWQQEVDQAKRFGLEAAESIVDRNISTFSRGELPHFAGINTFMKAPYLEDVNQVGNYDVAIVGVPHDCGTTYRPGTRFGPQGIRRISASTRPTTTKWGWICANRSPSAMSATSSPFRPTTRRASIRSPKASPTCSPAAPPDHSRRRPLHRLSHRARRLPPSG